jgi:hypothetical protein
MAVEVRSKPAQPRPRRRSRFSLLGDGLLERTRSTILGLLGMIAAVGLGVIAVALPGDWPLVAGSPVPRAPVPRQSIGGAIALGAGQAPPGRVHRPSARSQRAAAPRGAEPRHPGGGRAAAPVATERVSSPATPVASPPPSSGHRGGGSHGAPAPAGQPEPASRPHAQQTQTATQPAAEPSPAPATPSSPGPAEAAEPPQPEAPAPEATASESNVPSWSKGQGHAYGREDQDHGHGRAGD